MCQWWNQILLQFLSYTRETGSKIRRNRILKAEDTSVLFKIMFTVYFCFYSSLVYLASTSLLFYKRDPLLLQALWDRSQTAVSEATWTNPDLLRYRDNCWEGHIEPLEPDLLSWDISSFKNLCVFLFLVLQNLELFPFSPEKGTK